MKSREEFTCPLQLTHHIIQGKWKPIILWQLQAGSKSLADLQRAIKGINQKMLIQHLKELQEFDMVDKKQYEGYPLRVEYSLSERGEKMMEVVNSMQAIGIEMMKEDGKEDLLREKGLI